MQQRIVLHGQVQTGKCRVFISPSPGYPGYLAVAILYVAKKSGALAKNEDVLWQYQVEQNLVKNEPAAWAWARDWLTKRFEVDPSLTEETRTDVDVESAP